MHPLRILRKMVIFFLVCYFSKSQLKLKEFNVRFLFAIINIQKTSILTENLADELEFANNTRSSAPISKTNALSNANIDSFNRERLESFTAEAQCDDHPPIIGTQGIKFLNMKLNSCNIFISPDIDY